jgi:hypothetical protein
MKLRGNVRSILKSAFFIAATAVLIVAYNNCSAEHGASSQSSIVGTGFWTCDDQLDSTSLFGRTYHGFLMNKCAACHSGGGPGPGAFASSGIQLAYTSFDSYGFSRINAKAVDGHSPAATPANQTDISALTERYISGLNTIDECRNSGQAEIKENQDTTGRINFFSKPISPNVNQATTISWNIQTESIPVTGFTAANFANMRIEADIQVFQRPGIVNYVLSNPRLVTNTGDVHIESLLFKINGKATPAQRAFYLVNTNIRAWNNAHPDFGKPDPNTATPINEFERQARLISGGAMVMLGEVRTTDVISVSIGKLEQITLPPPDLGPSVSFGQTTMQVNEGYRTVDIPINLSRPATEIGYAELVFVNDSTIKDECCRPTRNDNGDAIMVRHFDRDIQDFDINPDIKINRRINFDNGATRGRYLITFRAGESSQILRIKIVDDQRDEPNELLHLRIDAARLYKMVSAATNQDFNLTIIDNDAPYSGNAETYTDLLSDGGLLEQECLRCHNSVLFRGGYDITHYELMVNRSILIPGNPSSSLMFRRMDANIPELAPMPLTGLIDPLDRSRVASWILLGAPNN